MLDNSYSSYNNSFNTDINFIKIDGNNFYQGTKEGEYIISFDNEKPMFKNNIKSFYMADIPVTNKIYLQFIEDFGYYNKNNWCDEGWYYINENNIKAPLYWEEIDYNWYINMTDNLYNYKNINLNEPVCHISW